MNQGHITPTWGNLSRQVAQVFIGCIPFMLRQPTNSVKAPTENLCNIMKNLQSEKRE